MNQTVKRLVFLAGLFGLIGLVWLAFIQDHSHETPSTHSTEQLNNQVTPSKEVQSNNSQLVDESPPPLKTGSAPASPPKILDLSISEIQEKTAEQESNMGPNLPSNHSEIETPPDSEKQLLNLDPTSEDSKLLYKYKGKEEEQYNLMLGIQKDDVTIKTDVKANTEGQDVQYIEVEIKLPK
ncbi:MAG: hypothetical protein U9R28_06910 [Pseudomonadota bacterium]|nr:hypothetical protein [Pseudomonadota bacterium]